MDNVWSLAPGHSGLVTVIVTAFNQDWVLEKTLESIAAQTYRPLECIIVDDGSTDNTGKIIADFVAKHSHALTIDSIRQDNQGAQKARNVGINASKGELIQFLDGDDLLCPDKFEIQGGFLLSDAGAQVDVVYGDAQWLHEAGDTFCAGEKLGLGSRADFLTSMLDLPTFNPPFSYLCRRTAIERCGPWDPAIRINQDYDYFLRMACCGLRFEYIPSMTGFYRKHSKTRLSDAGMRLRAEDTFKIVASAERLLERGCLFTPDRRRALAQAYRRVGYWASGLDRELWKTSLREAHRVDPQWIPEPTLIRLLHRLCGFWTAERMLRTLRSWKWHLQTWFQSAA